MGEVDVVELVLSEGRPIHGIYRDPEFTLAEARLSEGIMAEDLQKALLRGHVKVKKPDYVVEQQAPVQEEKRRGRRKGKATE